MRLAKAATLVAVPLLALAACAQETSDLDAPDSPVARYDWSGGAGMAALLEGELELRDGCLIVNLSYDPYTPVVAVFPRAYTSWDAENEVLTYAGVDFHMGDSVAAGGGGVDTPPDDGFPDACIPLAQEEGSLFYIQDATIDPNER